MEDRVFRFEQPTQVKFLDLGSDEVLWCGGIAYGPNIICGCCGGIFEIADLYIDWDMMKDDPIYAGIESPLISFDYWVNINSEICGDM